MSYSLAFVLGLLTCLAAFDSAQAIHVSWNYTDQEFWKTVEEWDCEGLRQSPIDIDTNNLVTDSMLVGLTLKNFDQSYDGNFTNTGHSVQFNLAAGSPTASFINHLGTYELLQFHLHWGSTSEEGSEHTIDGRSYAGELHFVTRKTTGSATDGDAFAVLGVLLVNGTSSSASLTELNDNIPTVDGEEIEVSGVRPMDFLPNSLSYYFYEGSLTTPGCNEVVQWFLLRNPVSVSEDFLNALRTTVEGEDGIIDMNFRNTQNLNGREVMIQTDDDTGDSAAFRLIGKGLIICIALFVSLLYY